MKILGKIVMTSVVALAALWDDVAFAQLKPGPGELYPYVKSTTNIIVHRDEYGGLSTDKLFSRRVSTANQPVDLSSEENVKLPAQFEVKVESGSYDATTSTQCASGWRVPTYNEALVVILLQDELQNIRLNGRWITTTFIKSAGRDSWRYIINNWDAQEIVSWLGDPSGSYVQRICVRDIDTRSLGLSDL